MKPEVQTVYLDGDMLPYRVGFSTQRTIYRLDKEGEQSCSPVFIGKGKAKINKYMAEDPDLLLTERLFVETPAQALTTLRLAIQNIVHGSGCELFKVVLSGKENFRNEIATIQPYKGNRVDFEKPHHWQLLRDWLEAQPYTIIAEGEEADDVLSRAMIAGHVSASGDKDLNNTPGDHYNFNKGERYYVTEDEAMANFYRQCLTGDTADHIPGIRGIGPKRAANLVQVGMSAEEMETAVLEVYRKTYGDRAVEALTEVGRLLWMRRVPDEMWEPVTS